MYRRFVAEARVFFAWLRTTPTPVLAVLVPGSHTSAWRPHPQEQQQDEERYSRINRHKVQNQWRKLMRIAKVPALLPSPLLLALTSSLLPGRGAD